MLFGSCGIYKNQTAGPGHGYVDLLAAWMASWRLDTWLIFWNEGSFLLARSPLLFLVPLELWGASLFGVGPSHTRAGFGDQRYAEVYYVFHDVADHGGEALYLVHRALKVQFVVNL